MIDENIPQPDPDWDYYEIWHSLHSAKARIESGLKLLVGKEYARNSTDEKLKEILEPALKEIEQIIENDLTDYYDLDE